MSVKTQPRGEQIGPPTWPRYRIILGDAVWTGKGWDSDRSLAAVWASMRLVTAELQSVTESMYGEHPEMTLFTTIAVTIRAGADFRLDELAEYLAQNTHVHFNMDPPPLLDSAIMDIQIDWSKLHERDDKAP